MHEASFTALGHGLFAVLSGGSEVQDALIARSLRRQRDSEGSNGSESDDDDEPDSNRARGDDAVDHEFTQEYMTTMLRESLRFFDLINRHWLSIDEIDVDSSETKNPAFR